VRLDQAAIVLRSRGTLGSGDLAFRFVFALRRRLWLSLCALALLPALGGSVALRYWLDWEWLPLWTVAIAYGSVAQGLFGTAAGLLMFDRDTTVRAILAHFIGRAVPYSIAVAWTRLLSLALLPLSGLGLYLWVRWTYVHEAVLLEQASFARAGARSGAFSKGHLEDAFGVLLLLGGLNALVAIAVEELGHGLEQLLLLPVHVESLWHAGGSVYALCGYLLSLPLCAVLRFLSYIDGRTRRDGWDIQVRFMALASAAEAKALEAHP
jgi:hypothetical protein